jgi:hypothetical protein
VISVTGMPKTIYSVWLQGVEAAPKLVRFNFEKWVALNPDYRLRVLDWRDVLELFKGVDLPIRDMPMQAVADVSRLRLLRDNGGVWVDLTVLPVKPLSQWLDDTLTEEGFFAFERPGSDRPISNWFMAATPQNFILQEWWKQVERFWSKPRRLVKGIPADPVSTVSPDGSAESDWFPYFWSHYLFRYLLESDAEFAAAWDRCAKSSADSPRQLQPYFADTPNPTVADIRSVASRAPMQKLNWRRYYPLDLLATSLF